MSARGYVKRLNKRFDNKKVSNIEKRWDRPKTTSRRTTKKRNI